MSIESFDVADLDPADRAALEFSIRLTLEGPDEERRAQVTTMLEERKWLTIAMFCSYHQQMEYLGLRPWQWPPCWIVSVEAANVILSKGREDAVDGSGNDLSNVKPARLLKRMLACGVSPYHPDPIAALAVKRDR